MEGSGRNLTPPGRYNALRLERFLEERHPELAGAIEGQGEGVGAAAAEAAGWLPEWLPIHVRRSPPTGCPWRAHCGGRSGWTTTATSRV